MFSSKNHVGKLVEMRIAPPITPQQVLELRDSHLQVVGAIAGDFAIAVDLRRASVFPQQISDQLIAMMSQLNPRVLRSALLVNESAVLGMQVERAIEEAGLANRRAFRRAADLEAWLAEVLDAAELRRLQEFLAAGPC